MYTPKYLVEESTDCFHIREKNESRKLGDKTDCTILRYLFSFRYIRRVEHQSEASQKLVLLHLRCRNNFELHIVEQSFLSQNCPD